MEPVRLGVVGCGVIGPTHMAAAVASPLLELVAVADLIEERARAAAEKFKARNAYRSGAELLEDPEVEAVVLAFPTGKRTELALQAFAKGKHVLVEKPVAMNADEVRRMIAARGKLVAACCSSRFRFLEGARVAADFIASGALGGLRVVRCRNLAAAGPKPEKPRPDWRLTRALNGGGYLVNWGCYDLDYLLGITGWSLKPRTVFAQTWTVPPQFESHIAPGSDAETYYIALIRCEGGTVLSLERGEYMPAHSEDAWQVVGTKGSLTLKMTWGSPKAIVHDDTTSEQGLATRTLWEGEEDNSRTSAGPVTDFAAAIREGRPPMTSLERALVVQQITDAIYASAAEGREVAIGGRRGKVK
ncbi:MAG: Gfo/Idh/MocA family oxidoreductase [Planctomycetes bacterium]|nr:Gfo/Idh/MocA family oxidoreductase [Planctomycetota bacterium]